jgi:hypothetical protein
MLVPAQDAIAQKSKKNKGKNEAPKEKDKGKNDIKSLKSLTEKCTYSEGLLGIYSDTVSGESWVNLPDSMLDREFIYFSHINDGVAQSGYTRGSYQNSKVITFHKFFDRIEIHAVHVQPIR